jgi:predicted MFS family arabinose efflux permease
MKKILLLCAIVVSLTAQPARAITNFEICVGVGAATAVGAHITLTNVLQEKREDKKRETFMAAVQSIAMFGGAIGGSWLIDKYYCMRPFNFNEIFVRACTMTIIGAFVAQMYQRINAKLAKEPKA